MDKPGYCMIFAFVRERILLFHQRHHFLKKASENRE